MTSQIPSSLHVSRAAVRALDLLDLVIGEGRMSLTDAAARLELPASTALRHLKTLQQLGYLDRDEAGLFSAGPTFVRLALTALRDGPVAHLIATARPHLAALAATTGESSYLAVQDGSDAVYVATAESERAVRHVGWVGRSVPIDGTAVGAALVDGAEVHVNTGAAEPDVTAVVHGVAGPDGSVVAAISVLGPASRLRGRDLTRAGRAVAAAAAAFAADLGAPAE